MFFVPINISTFYFSSLKIIQRFLVFQTFSIHTIGPHVQIGVIVNNVVVSHCKFLMIMH